MKNARRPTPGTIALIVCLLLIGLRMRQSHLLNDSESLFSKSRSVTVGLVLDGDTFETSDGERVRLLGIDAPEVAHHDRAGEPFGPESAQWLRQRLSNSQVRLVTEKREKDMYGRTLAWVYDSNQNLINQESLATGNARLLPDFGLPQHLEADLYAAEARAAVSKIGLWAKRR